MQNTRKRCQKNRTSKYKGVQKVNAGQRPWRAQITMNGKPKHLGVFENEIDAAREYDRAAFQQFGEFGSLNFPARKECASS